MGCCRVYVCVSNSLSVDQMFSMSKKEQRAFTKNWSKNVLPLLKEAADSLRMIFQVKGHGVENAFYIGYWNRGEGVNEKAEGIVQALKEIGLSPYIEYVGD